MVAGKPDERLMGMENRKKLFCWCPVL